MKLQKLSEWSIYLAVFSNMLILSQFGEQIGNYFENIRLYMAFLFLPSLAIIAIFMIVQKWVSNIILMKIIDGLLFILFLILGALSLDFNIENSDNLIYILAYSMIYNRYLYSAILSLSFAGLYLSSVLRIQTQIKLEDTKENSNNLNTNSIFNDFLSAMINLVVMLTIAKFTYFGLNLLFSAIVVGINSYLDSINQKGGDRETLGIEETENQLDEINNDKKNEILNQEVSNQDNVIQESIEKSRRNPFILIILGVMVLSFSIMMLWPMEFILFEDGSSRWYVNTRVTMIDDTLIGLIILIVIAISMKKWIQNGLKRIILHRNHTLILPMIITGLGLLEIILIAIPSPIFQAPFGIGITKYIFPWMVLLIFIWIFTLIKNNSKSPEVSLGFLFIFGGLVSWASLLLTGDMDDSFSVELLTMLIVLYLGFIAVYNVIVEKFPKSRYLLEDKKTIQNKSMSDSPSNSLSSSIPPSSSITSTSKKSKLYSKTNVNLNSLSKPIKISLFIALAILPIGIFFVESASPNHFQILANIDNKGIFYLADPTTHIDQNFLPNFGLSSYDNVNSTIEISAARNEWEPVQMVMRPLNQNHMVLYDITFSGFAHESSPTNVIIPSNESTFEKYRVNYIDSLNNIIADQLEKLTLTVVNDGLNHPLWLNFYVPENAEAGLYNGSLSLLIGDSSDPNDGFYMPMTINLNITLIVYDFKLPDIPSLKSNFGFSTSRPEFNEVINMFPRYRMMHWSFFHLPETTLNGDGSINAINFTDFDLQMNEIYGYGTFTIGFHGNHNNILPEEEFIVNSVNYTRLNYSLAPEYNNTFKEYFELFESYTKSKTYIDDFGNNHRWYDDIYYNGDDEIDARGEEIINEALSKYRWLKNTVNMTFPIMQTSGYNKEILDEVDIWCQHGTGEQEPEVVDWLNEGKDMWLYTTRGPRFPNPSLSTSGFGIQSRAIAWQCFVFNFTNYLIWDIATPYTGNYGYGYQGWNGGTIMYQVNGDYMPSTRMELTREGFEDYEYFNLLKLTLEDLIENSPESTSAINQANQLQSRIDELFIFGYNTIMDYTIVNTLRNDIGEFLNDYSILK